MLTTHVESFAGCLDELKRLFPLHYERLALDKDRVPLSPRYDVYAALEAAGELSLVTLRAEGGLVGYWVSFVSPGLHYETCLTAIMDMCFIDPDHAGGALRLVRAVESELKRRGVQRWFAGEKLHSPCGRLYEAFGMEKIECTYSKWIGE